MKKGFTLIELLVVVLIIGILSSIALPQYRVAVNKARLVEDIVRIKALADAQELYYLANGEYSSDYRTLDIDLIPQNTGTGSSGSSFCYNGGCYFINWALSNSQGTGNYAYFWSSDTRKAGNVPDVYYGYQHSATDAGKRICCFYRSSPNGVEAKICKGFGGAQATHPNSAQSSRDSCYYF